MKKPYGKNGDLFIFLSLLLQFIVLILRAVASIIWNNYALLIESFHVGIDITITALVLISLKISRSSARNRYSYGLYKMEDLISLFIAMIVVISAFDILRTSFDHFPAGNLPSSVFQLASLVPLFLAGRVKVIAGDILKSPSLRSDGLHTYTDGYEGLGVAVGLILNYLTENILFYYAAIIIAAFTLFFTSYQIGRDSIISLLDLPKDRNMVKRIGEVIKATEGIKEIKSIKVRWAGPVIFAEVVLVVNSKLTIEEAHSIADKVENNVHGNMPEIKDIVVHLEPSLDYRRKVAMPVEGERISDNLARASGYLIYEIVEGGNTRKDMISALPSVSDKKNAQRLQKIMSENGVTDIVTRKAGEVAIALLREKGIRLWEAYDDNPDRNIEMFVKGNLKEIRFS